MARQPKAGAAPRETISPPSRDLDALPERVRAMRDLILEAAHSGDIADLRRAIERNETPPIFATGTDRPRTFADVIEFLKRRSFDGQGRETLAIIEAVLDQAFVKITRVRTITYEWPAFTARTVEEASEDERNAMWRCMRFANLASSSGQPLFERIGIGADGTWHYFVAAD
jgi:hypothetical protein